LVLVNLLCIGLSCSWGKSKCAAKRWLCAMGCSSFDFAEALAFHILFSVRPLFVVSVI
jgi:hypothetical protein